MSKQEDAKRTTQNTKETTRAKSEHRIFHNKTRDEICVCWKPQHKDPLHYNHRDGVAMKSHYQQEYVEHGLKSVGQFRPIDNLKNGKEFYGQTNYAKDYQGYRSAEEQANFNRTNNVINKVLKDQNYNYDHLHYTTSLPTLAEQGNGQNGLTGHYERNVKGGTSKSRDKSPGNNYVDRNLAEHYAKPAKFIKQRDAPLNNGEFQKDSEYTARYRAMKRDNSAQGRINYDNLHVYSGPLNTNQTMYQMEHTAKSPSKVKNDHLYDLNKRTNQLTYAQFMPKDNFGQGTEYQRHYYAKMMANDDCPISELPSLRESQKRMPKHMHYDYYGNDWKPEKLNY